MAHAPSETATRKTQLALVVGPVALLALAYFLSDAFRAEADKAAGILAQGDLEGLRDYIRSFGTWAPVASLLLMVVQAVAAPVPGFVVIFANGLSFGIFWGWVLSLVGQVLAAAVCFWIARALGRGPTSAVVGRLGLESADHWFARWGAHAVLAARMMPGMAFDAVSYAAGLTRMGFPRFIAATAIGAAPSTLLYAYLGERAPQFGWALLAATGVITAAIAVSVIVRRQAEPVFPLRWARTATHVTARLMDESGWIRLAVLSLFGLLAYLLIGQIVEPGFTDYWGYLLVQITVITVAVIWLSHTVAAAGGFSWITYLIVITAVYVDTLGNAAGLYERYEAYDKFVHAIGTAALAAAAYDILAALQRRGRLTWAAGRRARAAVVIALLLATGWEIYEFTADQLFETYRYAGPFDTLYDLVSDAGGAVAMTLLCRWRETARRIPERRPIHAPTAYRAEAGRK